MNVLVTAGNTQVPIDRVRCLSNIFTGRTGASIALEAYRRGHRVTLLTSHPHVALELKGETDLGEDHWRQPVYRTFEDLREQMEQQIRLGAYGAVIHSAAVSDYLAAGVFAPAQGSGFDADREIWHAALGQAPAMIDRAAAKIKSDEPELWLRLVRAPKLVDIIRKDWGFQGILVKFKLEVGLGDEQLLESAEQARLHSQADLMVANTLAGAADWAYLGPLAGGYIKIARRELAGKLLDAVASMEKQHG
jgi:phosphopantothenoylcysteine synthetase/decarboxylase